MFFSFFVFSELGTKKNNGFTVVSELGTKQNTGFTVFWSVFGAGDKKTVVLQCFLSCGQKKH